MSSITYKNELAKRKFYDYLAGPGQYSPSSIACHENAIWVWEDFNNKADFAGFTKTRAEDFKTFIKSKKKTNGEGTVSLSYCFDTLRYLTKFFEWLSDQQGYRKIRRTDIEYLRLTKQEVRMATQPKGQESPNVEEVRTLIESIKGASEVEMRDKALLSLTFLTGARITALSTLPMASFDRAGVTLYQDPALGVQTKASKRIVSVLLAISYKEPLGYFLEWFDYLIAQKKFGPKDPLFPTTKIENGKEALGFRSTQEVEPVFWKSASSARKIFQKRFVQAGLKYYHPHTFRHLLSKTIMKLPITEEQKKALSQNFGHEDVGTTFGSYGYGHIAEDRQIEIIKNIDFEGHSRDPIIQMRASELGELGQFIKNFNKEKAGKEPLDKAQNTV